MVKTIKKTADNEYLRDLDIGEEMWIEATKANRERARRTVAFLNASSKLHGKTERWSAINATFDAGFITIKRVK